MAKMAKADIEPMSPSSQPQPATVPNAAARTHPNSELSAPAPEVQNTFPQSLKRAEFQEPISELEGLLAQPRRAFLLGAGCSVCAGLPMIDHLTALVEAEVDASVQLLLGTLRKGFEGPGRITIEDLMSELVDHISLAERRHIRKATSPHVTVGDVKYDHATLRDSLTQIKSAIAKLISSDSGSKKIGVHRDFVRAVHSTLKSGKTNEAREPVDYFTLNYDTLLEDALSLERITLVDGFVGGSTAWWNPDEFDNRASDARLFKLHGSIDWSMWEGDVFPRRIRDGLSVPERHEHVLIWPAATKYREAQRDPYARLISFLRASLRPLESRQTVLCICGYAFADDHINIEIERSLREGGDGLTVVVLTSDPRPLGQLEKWHHDPALRRKVRTYADRGFFHGEKALESDASLPWWKFEVLTKLLGGAR